MAETEVSFFAAQMRACRYESSLTATVMLRMVAPLDGWILASFLHCAPGEANYMQTFLRKNSCSLFEDRANR